MTYGIRCGACGKVVVDCPKRVVNPEELMDVITISEEDFRQVQVGPSFGWHTMACRYCGTVVPPVRWVEQVVAL